MIDRGVLATRAATVASGLAVGVLACLALALWTPPAMAAEETCPNKTLREESNTNPATHKAYSLGLPDCRAYEMVSPLEKQAHRANDVTGIGLPVARDGGAVGFASESDFASPENYGISEYPEQFFLSTRTPLGWTTSSPFAPASLITEPFSFEPFGGMDFSPNMRSEQSACGIESTTEPDYQVHQAIRCALREPNGTWVPTQPYASLNQTTLQGSQAYLGGSANLSRIFIQPSVGRLLPADLLESGDVGIYEIAGMGTGSTQLRLVNVDNEGQELVSTTQGSEKVSPLIGDRRPEPPVVNGTAYHAISQNGDTVFFSANPGFTQSPAGGQQTVYARIHCVAKSSVVCKEDGNNEWFETVSVSSPCSAIEEITLRKERNEAEEHKDAARQNEIELELQKCVVHEPSVFEGASADGSKVFFSTKQKLLAAGTEATEELYEYDFAPNHEENPHREGHLVLISEGTAAARKEPSWKGADVRGVVRTSSDGSHVYFVARGVLTTEANANGEKAEAEAENLYGYDTETGETKFVAISGENADSESEGAESTDLENRHAQTTPDGRYLVFSSSAQLAGATTEGGAKAVYRFDFGEPGKAGTLIWVSHAAFNFERPNGGRGESPDPQPVSAYVAYQANTASGAEADAEDWNRAISGCPKPVSASPEEEAVEESECPEGAHDGQYIIFTTAEKLQADDPNGAPDVYEWRCSEQCEHPAKNEKPTPEQEASGEGEVRMISDGEDARGVTTGLEESIQPARAASGMTASGAEIFFFTTTQLVGQDTDELGDLYDARIEGGFPRPKEATCEGESCQGKPKGQPVFGESASSTGAAGGNLTETGTGPGNGSGKGVTITKLTRAQELAKALKACKGKPKKKRVVCESQARKKYGSKAKPKAKAKAKKSSGRRT